MIVKSLEDYVAKFSLNCLSLSPRSPPRQLGINPAVWVAGSELGACVRGRASSAVVRACARPLSVCVASCSDGREDRGCGVSRFPASCASWRVVASGRIVQRVRDDVE